jgi:hypothetical protein
MAWCEAFSRHRVNGTGVIRQQRDEDLHRAQHGLCSVGTLVRHAGYVQT